jgi:hypothetical protein
MFPQIGTFDSEIFYCWNLLVLKNGSYYPDAYKMQDQKEKMHSIKTLKFGRCIILVTVDQLFFHLRIMKF